MGEAGERDIESPELAEMRRQTRALEGIHGAVMWWLALSVLGVLLAVVYVVRQLH